MNIYVGNLSFNTTENQLRQTFEKFGAVSSVSLITDRQSGEPKGFGFVEMTEQEKATEAISGLNGQDMNGRTIKVSQAKPRIQSGNREGGNGYRKLY
ncbi:MAG: RNA-binding protein [Candidatus Zixiibacteriota bacterium]